MFVVCGEMKLCKKRHHSNIYCECARKCYALNVYGGVSPTGGSVAEWLACWTEAQKGSGSNCSRDAVG